MFYSIVNGESSIPYGIKFLSYPEITQGERVYKQITVPGRRGTVTEDTGEITDTEIKISIEFKSNSRSAYVENMQNVKKYFSSCKELSFSNHQDIFYKVKSVRYGDSEYIIGLYGTLVVSFICEPDSYYYSGKNMIDEVGVINNVYGIAYPVYQIDGEGVCTLTVNGKDIVANVGNNLIIDTDLKKSYRIDGELLNASITGDYEDAYLVPGPNTITITEGFRLQIKPNWRDTV